MSKNTLLGAPDALLRGGGLSEQDPKEADAVVAAGLRGIAIFKANDDQVIALKPLQLAVWLIDRST